MNILFMDKHIRDLTMTQTVNKQPTVIRTDRGLSVSGTRITLYTIMDFIKDGWAPHLIRDWFGLSDGQISDIIEYIDKHRNHVEAEYQLVLKQAGEDEKYWREYNREHFAKAAELPPKPGQEKLREKLRSAKLRLGMA